MTTRHISTFQPVGDAASALVKILPGMGHGDAVVALRAAESNGRSMPYANIVITFKQCDGWTVETS